jgi:hypothetical protein
MWRKLVQTTYRRKSLQRTAPETFLASRDEKVIFFLGALAQTWGCIETLIDEWVEDIHSRGGDKLIQTQLPPNLDRELDYLAEALRLGLVPQAARDEAAAIVQRLHQIKGFRHTFIHGRLIEVQEGMRVIVEHSRIRRGKRVRALVTFAHAQMLRHYAKAFRLESDLRAFLSEHVA